MKKILLFAAVTIFLASCTKEKNLNVSGNANTDSKKYADIVLKAVANNTVSTVNKNDKADKKDKEAKDIKISGSGSIVYIPNACGDGTLRFRSDGTGKSTHLGSISQVTTFCVDATTQQIISPIDGTATAANGEKLYYTLVGMGVDPATGLTTQAYIFTGGTGKFAGATGTLSLVYNVFTPTNYAFTGTGSISY